MTLAEFLRQCDFYRVDIGSIVASQAQRWMPHQAVEEARTNALFVELARRHEPREQRA
jgi:hypothetical protein